MPRRSATIHGGEERGGRVNADSTIILGCRRETERLVIAAGAREKPFTSDARLPPKRPGRPRKYLPMSVGTSPTAEQQRLLAARELFETKACSLNKLGAQLGISSGRISYIARVEKWQRPEPAANRKSSPDFVPEDQAQYAAREREDQREFAKLIGGAEACPADAITPVDVRSVPGKVQAAEAIAPLATGGVAVALLERHEAMLLRYVWLLEVYLRPERFVDRRRLTEDMWAEKSLAARRTALSILLPGEKDTLAGAIKTMSDALSRFVELKLRVLGLEKTKRSGAISPSPTKMPLPDAASSAKLNLSLAELRLVREAMVLLKRDGPLLTEPPLPPPPEPIDDLIAADRPRATLNP
jgi:hypothetical protein